MLSHTVTPALANALIGGWRVHRVVRDFIGSASCVFAGEALLTESDFSEEGEIRIGDRVMPANRTYRLERQAGSVLVFRGDEVFIRLDDRPSQVVRHQCGVDSYIGRLIFRGLDEWIEAWRVKGPRKNYASISRFHRLIQRA
ncbi:MAG: hypothetical protein JF620_03910 [Mesorhizobium sp.]|nr:hypothetical protein [Mesorhizobium sp.]